MPEISVVMSTFNETLHELSCSIHSIINQSFTDFEFIILDDNPKSIKIRKYLKTVNNDDTRIKLLFNKRNLGAALSRNKGVKQAKGRFIAIMDADDIAKEDRLSSQLSFLVNNGLDFVFPNYKLISNKGIIKRRVYDMGNIINQSRIYYIFSKISDISINSGWLIKKKVFDKLKGYRNIVAEDYDFITRAILNGYKLGFQKKSLMTVRFRGDSLDRSNILATYLVTNYYKKSLINHKIFSIKDIHDFLGKYINKRKLLRFNRFFNVCHNLKYNFKLIYIFDLVYYVLTTRFSIRFIYDEVKSTLKVSKLK